jgi:hypothetical protein
MILLLTGASVILLFIKVGIWNVRIDDSCSLMLTIGIEFDTLLTDSLV